MVEIDPLSGVGFCTVRALEAVAFIINIIDHEAGSGHDRKVGMKFLLDTHLGSTVEDL
ncbi:MAG: hypothetical protein OXC63_02390 [Aestuariivita sp.]|nr:hypothetical protein [Aestuariivita sp.]MCY4287422.1 hypothetical protein [Aestuariivita sp.]MCY4347256.1 hypothetical protein [Aestuariivita sp.]